MARVYNFSAGPSILPEPVLRKAAAELPEYRSSGQSVMEMSHRSAEYEQIIGECESLLRSTMGIPDSYKVLFLQGGATLQFSAVPLNLMGRTGAADYVVTGQFSKKAAQEAKRYGKVHIAASSEEENFAYIPKLERGMFSDDAAYVHICQNNTIYGTRYTELPDTGSIPLVADLSSCILSEPIDVGKYGLIYAGAQKNMAPAGLTVVIVREDLIGGAMDCTPVLMDYKVQADSDSMYNTPPCYPIYICKLVLEWLRDEMGGLAGIARYNREKAQVLYDVLDSSALFHSTVRPEFRSMMNVTFVTGDPELDKAFIGEAQKSGFVNIKGHRSVGGMRASIYNAMPIEGVRRLAEFMKAFETAHK